MRRTHLERLIAACALLAGGAASAQDVTGPYVGAALGRLEHDEIEDGRSELEDAAAAQRILAGYRFAQHGAVELDWTTSDELHDPTTIAYPAFPGADLASEYEIWSVKGMAVFPIGRFGLLLGLGYYSSDADRTVTRNGVRLLHATESEKGTLVVTGVTYDFERLTLRAEADFLQNVNGASVATTTVGVLFRF